jgi:hypothetical protein
MARSSTRSWPWNWARNNSGGIRPVAADEWVSVSDAARMLGTPPHRVSPNSSATATRTGSTTPAGSRNSSPSSKSPPYTPWTPSKAGAPTTRPPTNPPRRTRLDRRSQPPPTRHFRRAAPYFVLVCTGIKHSVLESSQEAPDVEESSGTAGREDRRRGISW